MDSPLCGVVSSLRGVVSPLRTVVLPLCVFRIFLSVLRDPVKASVNWRPRLIQIRSPCAKRLGDVLRLLLLKKRERC